MSEIRHHVYIIAHSSEIGPVAPIKVGISSNPSLRLAQFQTASPRKLEGVMTFKLRQREVALDIESTFHRLHDAFRLEGEWFDIDPVTAIHLLCSQAKLQLDLFGIGRTHQNAFVDASSFGTTAVQVIRRIEARRKGAV